MSINCGINHEVLDEQQIFLCHHCGMPVCQEHGWIVAADDAFADAPASPPPHDQPASRVTVPRPAMHCRACTDKYHKNAPKRHGWEEPSLPGRFPQQGIRP